MARIVYSGTDFPPVYADVNAQQVEVTIGRQAGNKIRMASNALSRVHAKIVFQNKENINPNIYIGLTYLTKDNENVIYDWRAPISSIFYDYENDKNEKRFTRRF